VECALLALIALTFSKPLSSLLFGSPDYPDLIVAMPVLLLGLCFQGIVYGYLRAQVHVIRAGSLLLATLVAMPLLASLVGPSVRAMFLITGVGWALLSLVFLFGTEVAVSRAWPAIRSLLRYGGPRVPGDILMLLLFSAPPIIAAHTDGIRAAGAVAFAMASLRMVGSVLAPITFFLLPSAARLLARGEREQARREVFVVARWILPVLAVGTIAFEIAGDRILSAYLGDSIAGGLAEVKLVMLAAVPWGTFVLLKAVVDAHHLNPINARNLLISSVAFAVAAAGLGSAHQSGLPILTAFVGSMFLLAALTVIEVIRITSSSPRPVKRLADA
jgi:O-antigen/teichoic acid export membrane protein